MRVVVVGEQLLGDERVESDLQGWGQPVGVASAPVRGGEGGGYVAGLRGWLGPRWRTDLSERRAATLLPLAWSVAVIIFFSLSPGKRGVYILPALPALALAAAAHLPEVYRRIGVQRASLALAAVLVVPALLPVPYTQLTVPTNK